MDRHGESAPGKRLPGRPARLTPWHSAGTRLSRMGGERDTGMRMITPMLYISQPQFASLFPSRVE